MGLRPPWFKTINMFAWVTPGACRDLYLQINACVTQQKNEDSLFLQGGVYLNVCTGFFHSRKMITFPLWKISLRFRRRLTSHMQLEMPLPGSRIRNRLAKPRQRLRQKPMPEIAFGCPRHAPCLGFRVENGVKLVDEVPNLQPHLNVQCLLDLCCMVASAIQVFVAMWHL